MKGRITRKRALLALGCTLALALATGAYAYFTSTGTGTGTAKVGTASAVTLKGTIAGNLYPGSSSTVSFTVDNPTSGQRVGTISLGSVNVDAGHSGCSTAAFSMPAVTVNKTFDVGNGQAVAQTGTLTMADTGTNQDACQGATLTLNLSSN